MKRAWTAWWCALCILALGAPAWSADAPAWSPERLGRLHAFMDKATAADGYLGGVTLVMHRESVVDVKAYGYRDLARRVSMTPDSIFRIYSMTKTVTSVALMMLVEEGKVSLEDPLSRYLPGFDHPYVLHDGKRRPASRVVTLHDLLTHTAGYPAGVEGDDEAVKAMERIDPHGAADLRDFAARMSRVDLAADPGTRFGYDGASLELIARVVEVASGQPFAQFLESRIFRPLGMVDTGFRVPPAQRVRVVDITTMGDDGHLRIADGPSAKHPGEPLNRYDSGAGGLYSTVGDYARFARMLLDGGTVDGHTLLGRKTVQLMMRNHLGMLDPPVTQFSPAEGFGIGGSVVIDAARRGQLGSDGQYGWTGAASTYYTIDPKEHLVAVLFLQHLPRDDAKHDLPRISRNFYNLVYQAMP
ncbi:serine hydrolase domain-containing protein [Pinirhizobacter sp.]|jgi:CubicO group peptidase (beta-lactamase class C family)|uniref:serine hydrolase domain-containing protein n=1 Tax=Pinirhizobacter sp. TaxID=2950432 RepID=UPI002F42E238